MRQNGHFYKSQRVNCGKKCLNINVLQTATVTMRHILKIMSIYLFILHTYTITIKLYIVWCIIYGVHSQYRTKGIKIKSKNNIFKVIELKNIIIIYSLIIIIIFFSLIS